MNNVLEFMEEFVGEFHLLDERDRRINPPLSRKTYVESILY